MTNTSVSAAGCSASSTIASAPCSPGAALAMRISTILRCANSDIERLSAISPASRTALDDVQLALLESLLARRRRESHPRLR
jgi:hypothetical protein